MSAQPAELELHRAALTGHCYRMLGSVLDADDAVQETMIRAWRGLPGFDGRSQLRTWLYRIATNVCLSELEGRARRVRPPEERPAGSPLGELSTRPREHWVEPIADVRALPADSNPAELAILRQSIRLAFVAALQHLPAKQRAVFLLMEVLGWSAAEVAELLATSAAGVNSALQRARATFAKVRGEQPAPISEQQKELADRYAEAFERYDVDALVGMLHSEVTLSMPPYELWLQGSETIREWMLGRGSGCRGSRLFALPACGAPAFAQYRPDRSDGNGGHTAWALILLEFARDRICGLNTFLDTEMLFPRFGMPLAMRAGEIPAAGR
jgi:RNA polymerase sigma-70 factor (ECF subfamily)